MGFQKKFVVSTLCPRLSSPANAWVLIFIGILLSAGVLLASESRSASGDERPESGNPSAVSSGQASSGIAQAAVAPPNGLNHKARPGAFVETLDLMPRDFSMSATYVGHLLPWERVRLKAEVEGTLETVSFEEGDAVTPKTELARVSTSQFALRRDLAREDLNLAQSNLSRDEDLAGKNLIPQSRLDLSRNAREVARLRLNLAEIDLAKSIQHSPIVGFVKTKGVEKGEFVSKGALIAEILDLRRVRGMFNVPERDVRHLEAGKKVTMHMDAFPGRDFIGTVLRVGLEADLNTRTFPVEAELPNSDGRLRPGMLTRVQVALASYNSQILVPRHTVMEREEGRVVFVVEDGRARERRVRTGASVGGEVQILEGLKAGDRLIVTGQQKLVPEEPVQVVSMKSQSSQR